MPIQKKHTHTHKPETTIKPKQKKSIYTQTTTHHPTDLRSRTKPEISTPYPSDIPKVETGICTGARRPKCDLAIITKWPKARREGIGNAPAAGPNGPRNWDNPFATLDLICTTQTLFYTRANSCVCLCVCVSGVR